MWRILTHLYTLDLHCEQLPFHKSLVTKIVVKTIHFPVKAKDIPEIEKINNVNIKVSVFTTANDF